MDAMDRTRIQQEMLRKYPKKDPEMDIDWDIVEISFKVGVQHVLSCAVIEGCLSTVNGEHGVHIPDKLFEKLKKECV